VSDTKHGHVIFYIIRDESCRIDTSTTSGSVGLIEDEEVVAEHLLNIPVTHSERLLDTIDLALREARGRSKTSTAGRSAPVRIFTGLRIGVSTVKGWALPPESRAGVPTLDVLASQISPLLTSSADPRRPKKGGLYRFYRYEEGLSFRRRSAYQAIGPDDLVKKIGERTIFIGDGVKTYGDFSESPFRLLPFFRLLL